MNTQNHNQMARLGLTTCLFSLPAALSSSVSIPSKCTEVLRMKVLYKLFTCRLFYRHHLVRILSSILDQLTDIQQFRNTENSIIFTNSSTVNSSLKSLSLSSPAAGSSPFILLRAAFKLFWYHQNLLQQKLEPAQQTEHRYHF